MRTVYRYPVAITDIQIIELPVGAEILAVARREGRLAGAQVTDAVDMWALVDPDAPVKPRRFRIVGTGHAVEDGLTHLGSVQIERGALVFHVFEDAA